MALQKWLCRRSTQRPIQQQRECAGATGSTAYTTQYVYDTFGPLQTLTYPDGEVLTYAYDSGGQVRQVSGAKASISYDYVKRLEYDKFEQRAFLETGNGVQTQYSYRPDNRRLETLKAGKDSDLFQNLAYRYDKVGNILSLANDVAVPPPSQFGGPSTQTYTYDDLNRLVEASGTYQFNPNKTRRYSLNMAYDTLGNIISKQQDDKIVQGSGGTSNPQAGTSYDWIYSYDGPQPHAPMHVGERTFSYDANGNQTGWTDDHNGTRRTIVWDEENRVQSIAENGHTITYKYDAAGQRVIKRGPQGETAYVNQYFTVRNGQIGTKHIFVGTSRLVSKLVKQADPLEPPPVEKDQYFYHPDHLGSTSYVTDANGRVYQHMEYFPFGETWVGEASNTQRTPYGFTGKELDEETGLYDYGARYYDPRVSQFISADTLDPGHTSQPLNRYSYAFNNPLSYRDPTGHAPEGTSQHAGVDQEPYIDEVVMPPNTPAYLREQYQKGGKGYELVAAYFKGGPRPTTDLDVLGLCMLAAPALIPVIVEAGVTGVIEALHAAEVGKQVADLPHNELIKDVIGADEVYIGRLDYIKGKSLTLPSWLEDHGYQYDKEFQEAYNQGLFLRTAFARKPVNIMPGGKFTNDEQLAAERGARISGIKNKYLSAPPPTPPGE
jgi:RHS repeat-associated protein